MPRPPPRPTLFPYTTLFRSRHRPSCGTRGRPPRRGTRGRPDRKSTRLNSSHASISYAVFCLKKKGGVGGARAAARGFTLADAGALSGSVSFARGANTLSHAV